MSEGAKKSQKGRKIGRNKKWCEAYRARDQRGINKAIKLARHLRRFPGDLEAWKSFEALSALSRKRAGVSELAA